MAPARTFPDGTRPNMFFIAVFVVLCSAIGAAVVSSAVAGLLTLINPSWSRHTMRGLAFILSFPIGTVLGGTFGYVWIKYDTPSITAGYVFSVVGGVTTFICLLFGIGSADSRGFSVLGFALTIASPWCVAPLIASVAMLTRGVLLLKGQEKASGNISLVRGEKTGKVGGH